MRAIGAFATAVLLAGAAIGTPARADDYPSRPVHIMVGFIPGSAADITARVLGNGPLQASRSAVRGREQARRRIEPCG